MFDLVRREDAQRCISSGASLCVFWEIVFVGYEVWIVALGHGAHVFGTYDVP